MMEFVPFLLLVIISTLVGSNTAENRSPAIEQIIKQAIHTFTTPQDRTQFQANLDDLSQRVNRLTLSDVPASQSDDGPVSYVGVYEDSNITIGMFIMKPNSMLPLHNHPLMHGILKVLRGSVRVQSYSHYLNDGIRQKNEFEVCLPSERYFLDKPYCTSVSCGGAVADDDTFFVCKNAPIILDHTSDCGVLTPVMNNFHEIRAHNGTANFFDILAPPYHSFAEGMGPRECTYFEEVLGVTKENTNGNDVGHQCENVTLQVFQGEPIYSV